MGGWRGGVGCGCGWTGAAYVATATATAGDGREAMDVELVGRRRRTANSQAVSSN